MTLRAKTKRRLLALIVVTIVLIIGGGVVVGLRMRQIQQQTLQNREDGMAAFENGDYILTLDKLGPYLQESQDDVEALYAYAKARQSIEEPDGRHLFESMGVYRRILTLEPGRRDARQALLNIYPKIGYYTEAIELADDTLADQPDSTEALRGKVISHYRLGDHESASGAAIRLSELESATLHDHLLVLDVLKTLEWPDEQVLAHTTALKEQHPDDVRYDLIQAAGYAIAMADEAPGSGQYDAYRDLAIERLEAVEQTQPTDPAVVEALVKQYDRFRKYDRSLQVMTHSVSASAQSNHHIVLRRMLIRRLWESGYYQDIDKYYSDVNPEPAADSVLMAFKALTYARMDQNDKADPYIQELQSRKNDQKAQAWASVLDVITAEKLEPLQILDTCKRALARDPGNPYFHQFIGNAYAMTAENDLAMTHWSSAYHAEPAWAEPVVKMAQYYAASGKDADLVKAVMAAQEAVNRNPRNIEARIVELQVMALLIEKGHVNDLEQAQQAAMDAITNIQASVPGEPRSLLIKIALLHQMGKPDQARQVARSMLESDKQLDQETMLRLSHLNHELELGLSDESILKYVEKFGNTPELAYAQAIQLYRDGKPEEGLDWLTIPQNVNEDEKLLWQITRATYMDMTGHGQATDTWRGLAQEYNDHPTVQRMVLEARASWKDRDLIDRTIKRLRELTADQGLAWKLARARWLLMGKDGEVAEQDAAQAAIMLNEIIGVNPQASNPHKHLAEALVELGNISGAIEQLTIAARLEPDVPAIPIQIARLYQQQKDPENALRWAERAMAYPTIDLEQRSQVASILATNGREDRAITLLQEAAGATESSQAQLQMARLYRQNRQYDKVDQISRQLMQGQPGAAEIQFVADYYGSRGRLQEAEQVLGRLEEMELKEGLEELILAQHAFRYDSPQAALENARLAVRAMPDNLGAWRLLTVIHLAQDDLRQAVDTAGKAVQSLPKSDSVTMRAFVDSRSRLENLDMKALAEGGLASTARALMIAMVNQPERSDLAFQALPYLQRMQEPGQQLEPTETLELQNLADRDSQFMPLQQLIIATHFRNGNVNQALARTRMAMHASTEDTGPINMALQYLEEEERWRDVIQLAQELAAQNQAYLERTDYIIANAYMKMGQPEDARRYLQRHLDTPQGRRRMVQLATDPNSGLENPEEWMNEAASHTPADAVDEQAYLAANWYVLGHREDDDRYTDQARSTIARMMAMPDANSAILFNMGLVAEQMQDPDTAERIYRHVLANHPDSAMAANNLSMLLARQSRDLDEALQLANQAVAHSPDNASYHDTLAYVRNQMQDQDGAIASLRKAVSLDPDNPLWQINLAQILADSGHQDEAMNIVEELTTEMDDSRIAEPLREQVRQLRQRLATPTQAAAS